MVDPLVACYAIKQLTMELEKKPIDYIEKIDAMGGMLRAIETGYVQKEIQDAAYDYQRRVETKDAIVVGVNRFQSEELETTPVLAINEQIERDQVARVRAVREKRDSAKADSALNSLKNAAAETENLLPRILACVEAEVTVGEISHCLRAVWGEYREAVTV
jgi:methylmalonyl-CoA mutase N-terminal domain/subunit